jgi:hypothetical protein
MVSMSLTASRVPMCLSRVPYLLPHAFAKDVARLMFAFSSAPLCGTGSGRTGLKYRGLQASVGLLLPTPRGSKPMTSYRAETAAGSDLATNPASASPLPPGPPGLTSNGPRDFLAVCRTRDSARVIFRPSGRA